MVLWCLQGEAVCDDCADRERSRPNSGWRAHTLLVTPVLSTGGRWEQTENLEFGLVRRFIDACLRPGTDKELDSFITGDAKVIEVLMEILTRYLPASDAPTPTCGWDDRNDVDEAMTIRQRAVRRLGREYLLWRQGIPLSKLTGYLGHTSEPERVGLIEEIFGNVVHLERVNWILLEPAESGFQNVTHYFERIEKAEGRILEIRRLQAIYDFVHPDTLALGKAEFHGYVAFVYKRGNSALLESAYRGNALYLVPADRWLELSRLSKTELTYGQYVGVERIEHRGSWFESLKVTLQDRGVL